MQHEQMQQHPQPPSSFFIFKDDSSQRPSPLPRTTRRTKKSLFIFKDDSFHRHTSSKNNKNQKKYSV